MRYMIVLTMDLDDIFTVVVEFLVTDVRLLIMLGIPAFLAMYSYHIIRVKASPI